MGKLLPNHCQITVRLMAMEVVNQRFIYAAHPYSMDRWCSILWFRWVRFLPIALVRCSSTYQYINRYNEGIMEQIFTGPGKVTIELTPPKPPPLPGWKSAFMFIVKGLLILGGLTLFNYVTCLWAGAM